MTPINSCVSLSQVSTEALDHVKKEEYEAAWSKVFQLKKAGNTGQDTLLDLCETCLLKACKYKDKSYSKPEVKNMLVKSDIKLLKIAKSGPDNAKASQAIKSLLEENNKIKQIHQNTVAKQREFEHKVTLNAAAEARRQYEAKLNEASVSYCQQLADLAHLNKDLNLQTQDYIDKCGSSAKDLIDLKARQDAIASDYDNRITKLKHDHELIVEGYQKMGNDQLAQHDNMVVQNKEELEKQKSMIKAQAKQDIENNVDKMNLRFQKLQQEHETQINEVKKKYHAEERDYSKCKLQVQSYKHAKRSLKISSFVGVLGSVISNCLYFVRHNVLKPASRITEKAIKTFSQNGVGVFSFSVLSMFTNSLVLGVCLFLISMFAYWIINTKFKKNPDSFSLFDLF